MSTFDPEEAPVTSARPTWQSRAEAASFWLLIATLAWAPFPLGSNRPWSWSFLTAMIAFGWVLWLVSIGTDPTRISRQFGRVAGPLVLAGLALLWGFLQILPLVPAAWSHPVWSLSADALGRSTQATVSLNAWRSGTELMKIVSYMSAGWLSYALTQRSERARQFLIALVCIGTFYAIYALAFSTLGIVQDQLFYATPPTGGSVAAPFILHNSLATYVDLTAIAASVLLYFEGMKHITASRGIRKLFLTAIQFVFGRGVVLVLAMAIAFLTVIASGSRAGFLALLAGLAVTLFFATQLSRRKAGARLATAGTGALAFFAFMLFLFGGNSLPSRFNALIESGAAGEYERVELWGSAAHAIESSPWLGVGLGAFENAYPLYTNRVLPFVVDKAHNDYLEFASGLGLPAALALWAALCWLFKLNAAGLFARRRHHMYALISLGSIVLVAVHSAFDFSLQIPAVAFTFAVTLGLGVSQSFSSRS